MSTSDGIHILRTLKDIISRKLVLNRRKNRRFKAQDHIFVVFAPLLNNRKQVIDISMSGLSHIDEEDHFSRSVGLNILADNTLYFDDNVSYIPIPRSGIACLDDFPKQTNLRAVQFKGLTLSQKSQLEIFIQTHTAEGV